MPRIVRILTLLLCALGATRSASAQMWAEADYLFWNRVNTSDRSFLNGVGGMDSGDLDLGYTSGYRLILGGGIGNYEVEGSFLRIDEWSDDRFGTLANPLAFDDTRNNALVFPGGPASVLAFRNSLFAAATQSLAADETNESEFLAAGAASRMSYQSSLRDVQANFGRHRDLGWWRWSIGYRGIKVNEVAGFGVAGPFNALDIDDAEGPAGPGIGVNEPNDGLSDAALVAAGFTNVRGAADGFDAVSATGDTDIVAAIFGGSAANRLNGVQIGGAARLAPINEVMFEGFLKLGLFHNHIDGAVNEIVAGSGDDDSVYVRRFSQTKDKASVGANFGVRALLNVTDYLTLTAGYEALVLSGIALGPDQIGRLQTNVLGATSYALDSSGVFIAHGGSVGLEVRW